MTAPGIRFVAPLPPLSGPSSRADIAVFVGLVGRQAAPLAAALRSELVRQGWLQTVARVDLRTDAQKKIEEQLLNIPVAVESWSAFETLYTINCKAVEKGSPERIACPLALAVKAFFAEGGRKAYIVRVGDPLPLVDLTIDPDDFRKSKSALLDWFDANEPDDASDRVPLLPGLANPAHLPDPGEKRSWLGLAAIYGIEDAAMLLLPDLIDLCAGAALPVADLPEQQGPAEQFKDCAPPLAAAIPAQRAARPQWRAARLDQSGYASWARATRHALNLLGQPRGPAHRRDIMLVGSVPLPLPEAGYDKGEERNPYLLLENKDAVIDKQSLFDESLIGSGRLQLAYPWVKTPDSAAQPEGIQLPEGHFAGILARSAMLNGAFYSCAGQHVSTVQSLLPELTSADIARSGNVVDGWLGERISLFGRRYDHVVALSDATMAASKAWRAGGVSRLMGIILRGTRHLGQDLLFEPSGPSVWARLESMVSNFLEGLRQKQAFSGSTPAECYTVTCDRSSMTQADLDAGRIIARVSFSPAYPVERITVSLALVEPPAFIKRRAA